jgi:hypothetical protein
MEKLTPNDAIRAALQSVIAEELYSQVAPTEADIAEVQNDSPSTQSPAEDSITNNGVGMD